MIARTTLAVMLACPAATAVFISPHMAFASINKTCKTSCTPQYAHIDHREASAHRPRLSRFATARRQAPVAADAVLVSSLFPGDTTRAGAIAPSPLNAASLSDGTPEALPAPIPLASISGHPWQTGVASWYGGPRWQGHATSSGHLYDENEFTAAHASLPLGSHAIVRLTGSDRAVVVKITDRPGTRRRVIDLSRAAAAQLGILSRGVAQVSIDPM